VSVSGFLQWWGEELQGLLPASRRKPRVAALRIIVDVRADGFGLLLDERGQIRPLVIDDAAGAEVVTAGQLPDRLAAAARLRLPVGIRVQPTDCFVRTVALPAAAHRNFERMLLLDLERTTPFKARDVFSAHAVERPADGAPPTSGIVQVRHFVIKTRRIEPVIAALRNAGLEPSFIDCWTGDASPPPFNFQTAAGPAGTGDAHRARSGRQWSLGRSAAAMAAVLGLAAPMILWGRQELVLAQLTAETQRLQVRARDANRAGDAMRAANAGVETMLRLKAQRAGATVILDEVTRLLPDTAWLQEFRIDNDLIEIAGLAAAAAPLLPAFERSALFHETIFAGPLRFDPGEDRERFRLRTRLRPAAGPASASAASLPTRADPLLPKLPEAKR
jgi:general secretion pathway protein L